jgi:anthranilate synthase component 1
MIYLQARGSILVASSPEILCRLGDDRTVTNRFVAVFFCRYLCV